VHARDAQLGYADAGVDRVRESDRPEVRTAAVDDEAYHHPDGYPAPGSIRNWFTAVSKYE
jgi:hypothetical protein